MTVGRHGVVTAEEARRRAALIVARIKTGEEPAAEPLVARRAEGPTVAEACPALARRARHGALQAEDGIDVPADGGEAHPAGAGEDAGARGRARPRDGTPPSPARDAGDGEPGGGHNCRGSTTRPGTGGRGQIPEACNPCRLVAKNRERKRERFLADAELRRLGGGAGRGREAEGGIGLCGGGDPAVATDRLPQGRDPVEGYAGRAAFS